tara:strand:+ start:4244 stop:6586 length:2343 start_codon:yes stop_codon:yes gene_type:complete
LPKTIFRLCFLTLTTLASRPVAAQIFPTSSASHATATSAESAVPEQSSVKTSEPILAPQRTNKKQMVLRAHRINQPLNIDGVIDEPFYKQIDPISDFTQTLPEENGKPSELTELWIGFDDQNVYVSAKIWDSSGPDGWIANEMRRDEGELRNNDHFGIWFDTFYDRRNGVGVYVNPLGGIADYQITNETNVNKNWNPIHDTRTALFDGGWSLEMAIPFRSLRYRPGKDQTWGVQTRRSIMRNNEWIFLSPVPRSVARGGAAGSNRVSLYATLEGIEAPPSGNHLEVKPYAISGIRTDLTADPTISNDSYADAGLDIKYGITENLTADFTYNTDFAQVEIDEQQVNLTRFSLRLPEKREFFVENSGLFNFGPRGMSSGGRGQGRGQGAVPTLFYSRNIGLKNGTPIPILGGGRVTGKIASFDIGLVTIQTDDLEPVDAMSTNFSVLRLRRDIFSRSNIGMLFENRSRSLSSSGSNQGWGIDGSFGFSDNLSLTTYYAKTATEGLNGMDGSYNGKINYAGDKWGGSLDHLVVGSDFNPEMGFVRRKDFRQTAAMGRFSPRPTSISWIRQISLQFDLGHLENERTGILENQNRAGEFKVELENSDQFKITYTDTYENLLEDAYISGASISKGEYSFPDVKMDYTFGPQRPYSGNLSVRRGEYYGGNVTSLGMSRARMEITPQLSLQPSISFNWLSLPQGQFDQHVAITRLNYTLTPRAYVSTLVQYNSRSNTLSGNFRLRWEWAPGSEVFIVYTEDRDTDIFDRWSQMENRGLIIKVNRLFQV